MADPKFLVKIDRLKNILYNTLNNHRNAQHWICHIYHCHNGIRDDKTRSHYSVSVKNMGQIIINRLNIGTTTSFIATATTLATRLLKKTVSVPKRRIYRRHLRRLQCRYHVDDTDNDTGNIPSIWAILSVIWWHNWHRFKCQFQEGDTGNDRSVSVTLSTLATTTVTEFWSVPKPAKKNSSARAVATKLERKQVPVFERDTGYNSSVSVWDFTLAKTPLYVSWWQH